jgi:mutual gliding-motility protein MglA
MKRLLYTGTGLSGRTTSLLDVSRVVKPLFDPMKRQPGGWMCEYHQEGGVLTLEFAVSTWRSLLTKDVAESVDDERFAPEIAFLRIIDGIVFVVDSQRALLPSAKELLDRTIRDLTFLGREINHVPMVFQLNKRDLPTAATIERLRQVFRWPVVDYVETVATKHVGTVEALHRVIRLMNATAPCKIPRHDRRSPDPSARALRCFRSSSKEDNSGLLPDVTTMKRLNKFGRKRKTVTAPTHARCRCNPTGACFGTPGHLS